MTQNYSFGSATSDVTQADNSIDFANITDTDPPITFTAAEAAVLESTVSQLRDHVCYRSLTWSLT